MKFTSLFLIVSLISCQNGENTKIQGISKLGHNLYTTSVFRKGFLRTFVNVHERLSGIFIHFHSLSIHYRS
jgi:hypothetical protein